MPRYRLADLDELSQPFGVIFVTENGVGPGVRLKEEAEAMPTKLPERVPTVRELLKGYVQIGRIMLARLMLWLARTVGKTKPTTRRKSARRNDDV